MLNFSTFSNVLEFMEFFKDEQTCIRYFERIRWEGGIYSPFDKWSIVYRCKEGRYKCKNTGKYFNVKTGTIFEGTKVPLRKWFIAFWYMSSIKKGIPSTRLAEEIGVTQSTAWKMLSKIRYLMDQHPEEKVSGTIEVDETFVGGKNKNRHSNKKVRYSRGRSFADKTVVFGALNRDTGKVYTYVVESTKSIHLWPVLLSLVKQDSTVYSDEWKGYNNLSIHMDHHYVRHSQNEYTRGEIHTNGIEGFWSHLKRGIIGVYHGVSPKYLQLYCNEYAFRYNYRDLSTSDKFNILMTKL